MPTQGIYTDVAAVTCAGYEGSGDHWPLDALTYAQWGFDMIEADFCDAVGVARDLYTVARDAIAAATVVTGRLVAFYQCNWGAEAAWLWGPVTANVIRNTGDICAPGSIAWEDILSNFDNTVQNSNTPGLHPGLPGERGRRYQV